jgi:hypothetical protein
MTVVDDMRAARNPQEAMLVIAEALDAIIVNMQAPQTPTNTWGTWESDTPEFAPYPDVPVTHMLAGAVDTRKPVVTVTVDEGEDTDSVDVNIAPVSPKKQEARRRFAADVLQLEAELGAGVDWAETYAKGGPVWLYEGNRELVMQYPQHIRSELVRDLMEDDPQAADEMGRDILKLEGADVNQANGMLLASKDVG